MYKYYRYEKTKLYHSDCHIFEFNTSELNIDAIGLIDGCYERLSSINIPLENDNIPIVKVLASLPNTSDSFHRPTAVIWNNGNLSILEDNPSDSIYSSMPRCMFGCDATLIINGEEKIAYPYYLNKIDSDPETVSHLKAKRSRTILGQTDHYTTILIIVDSGRFFSRGINIKQCMDLAKEFDCINACILSDSGKPQLLYKNEIMTFDKYERREEAALIISGSSDCKKDGCVLCTGKINSKPYAIMYNESGSPKTSIDNDIAVRVYDVDNSGKYLIRYCGEFGYVKGTQIKLI